VQHWYAGGPDVTAPRTVPPPAGDEDTAEEAVP
jgi:hypothetical protein